MGPEDKLQKDIIELRKLAEASAASPDGFDRKTAKHYTAYLILIAFAALCVSVLFYMGPDMTGYVVFSESVTTAEPGSISATESGSTTITSSQESINSVLLSGKVTGKGKAAVFIVKPDRNYLAYYFEGDASEGVSFTDMCYDTCHLEGIGRDITLWFELEGTRIDISNVKYMYSRIIDFDLQPRKIGIEYSKDPSTIIDLRLTNRELTDYTVLLYIDGPLSSSFSWQGSLIHMTAEEPEKRIPIEVRLPSNLPPGEYVHKITARYVPPGTHEFIGESPVSESFITVYS